MERKKAKVIMLPTDKACEGCVIRYDRLTPHYMVRNITYQTQEWLKQENNRSSHHLYIVTDDEIKEGDWALSMEEVTKDNPIKGVYPYKVTDIEQVHWDDKKIIATTDSELSRNLQLHTYIPKPSKAFIEKYCKEGGIDEVEVEYQVFPYKTGDIVSKTYRLKVNSHNEITIHPIKDSWSREEVESLCRKAYEDGFYEGGLKDSPCKDPVFWIKENL